MTVYFIFAAGPDQYTGALDTLSGTIDVTNAGVITGAYLQVTGYALPFYGPPSVVRLPDISEWSMGISNLTVLLGTRSSLPTFGTDIFGFTACCVPVVSTPSGGSNYGTTAQPLGTIPNLALPLSSVPAPELGTGWTSLLIVALMWGCYRHRRAMR